MRLLRRGRSNEISLFEGGGKGKERKVKNTRKTGNERTMEYAQEGITICRATLLGGGTGTDCRSDSAQKKGGESGETLREGK